MFDVGITFPEILLASPRTHNKFVRNGVEKVLEDHHREQMPQHFEQAAAGKYGHMKRNPAWIKYKIRRYRTGTDLVASGRTKAHVLAHRTITMSGAATAETLRGRLTMRLPFGGGTGRQFDDAAYDRLQRAYYTETDPRKRASILRKLANRENLRGKTGVTPAQMVKELQTVTPAERRGMAEQLKESYLTQIKSLKRPRQAFGVTI